MEDDSNNWKFAGFSSPNFTSVPDEFFDVLSPRLNGGEVKVLLYIIRRTFGFKKERDSISLSQMIHGIVKKTGERLDYGTGMSKPSICRALDTLEEKGIILSTKQFDFKGGCVATIYQLNMKGVKPVPDTRGGASSEAGEGTPGKKMRQGGLSQNFTRGVSHNLTRPLVKKRDTQYTVNNIQEDKNVNVQRKRPRSRLHDLVDLDLPSEEAALIAADILAFLGDRQSEGFYRLIARKVPEAFIRRTLSEVRQSGAVSPARVFTSKVMAYVNNALGSAKSAAIADGQRMLKERFQGG